MTGNINGVTAFNLNLGKLETSGIDTTLQTSINLGSAGTLDIYGSLNWTEHYLVTNLPGDVAAELAGSIGNSAGSNSGVSAAFPKWKGLLNLTYRLAGFQIGGQYRYISAMRDASSIGVANSTAIGTPAYSFFDLNVQYEVDERLTFKLGVVNLTDKQPSVYTSFYQSNTYPGVYDVLGRSFYSGVSAKF